MRLWVLLLIVLIVVVLIAIGALTFQTGDGDATIRIDTDPIRESTERAVDEGRELIERVGGDEQRDAEQSDVEPRDADASPQPPAPDDERAEPSDRPATEPVP